MPSSLAELELFSLFFLATRVTTPQTMLDCGPPDPWNTRALVHARVPLAFPSPMKTRVHPDRPPRRTEASSLVERPFCDSSGISAGQYLAPLRSDGDRVLEVGRQRPVGGHHRPPVRQSFRLRPSEVEHRLNRQGDTHDQQLPPPWRAEIRDPEVLVELSSDPVTRVLADHRETRRRRRLVHRVAHVTQVLPGPALVDGGVEAGLGDLEQVMSRRVHLSHREGPGRIAVPPLVEHADVERHD